jgi:hypothetical protein
MNVNESKPLETKFTELKGLDDSAGISEKLESDYEPYCPIKLLIRKRLHGAVHEL